MHDEMLTLGEVVSVLFESFVATFGDEEVAAHATSVTVGRWFVGRVRARCPSSASPSHGEYEIEA